MALESVEPRILLATFLVTDLGDSGPGTLRQAIEDANEQEGVDQIHFAIPGPGPFSVALLSPLPPVTDTVEIDGTTQPGFNPSNPVPIVEVNGAGAGSGADGLTFDLGSFESILRGLVINRFSGSGVRIFRSQVVVEGNFIGTDLTGSLALGNAGFGVEIDTGFDNRIGGTTAAARNVISGNAGGGVRIFSSFSSGASRNQVLGNFIGLDAAGTGPLGNGGAGIYLGFTADDNEIGGTSPGEGNAIAFNGGHGVTVDAAIRNPILGNRIFGNAQAIVLTNGGNEDQPAPTLAGAEAFPAFTRIEGQLIGFLPLSTFRIEFFSSLPGDPPIPGQASLFLGAQAVATDAAGNASFSFDFTATPPIGQVITATATSPLGGTIEFPTGNNTSELALGIPLVSAFVVTNTNDTGVGSFRRTIGNANEFPGLDTIRFDIPGPGPHSIAPLSQLPPVLESVIIDATTQPGFNPAAPAPVVELNGALAGANASGLRLNAGSSTIRGLAINRFSSFGIRVASPANRIVGNFIGTDPSGSLALGNGSAGVGLVAGGNTIGGSAASDRNLISGNLREGIFVATGAGGNQILGNFIGTTSDGNSGLGNQLSGITLNRSGGNLLRGNLISGNGTGPAGGSGITITGAEAVGNHVADNRVGTNASATHGLPNVSGGIFVSNASGNLIGGGTGDRNILSGNGFHGIFVSGGSANSVLGNLVGTAGDGATPLGNLASGIALAQSSLNVVRGNVVSGNRGSGPFGGYGVIIQGSTSHGNLVQGNLIGTDSSGGRAIPNSRAGVAIRGPSNVIGGSGTELGNVISGNGQQGVLIEGTAATGNLVQGNLVGTDAAGFSPLPNGSDGLVIQLGATGNLIGGPSADLGNLVSGNHGHGVRLIEGGAQVVQFNRVGTDASGTRPLPNHGAGILLEGSSNNLIQDNLISGNLASGIGITPLVPSVEVTETLRGNLSGPFAGTLEGSIFVDGQMVGDFVLSAAILQGTAFELSIPGIPGQLDTLFYYLSSTAATATLGPWSATLFGEEIPRSLSASAVTAAATILSLDETTISETFTINGSLGGFPFTFEGTFAGRFIDRGPSVPVEVVGTVSGPLSVTVRGLRPGFVGTAAGNQILANQIGTAAGGDSALGNGLDGITINSSGSTLIAGNLISGNGLLGEAAGINMQGPGVVGNILRGNLIGTNAGGNAAVGNSLHGVVIGGGASGNIVGPGNLISGNGSVANQGVGVFLAGPGTTGNLVIGNVVGTDAGGAFRLTEAVIGVLLSESAGNAVVGNLISGHRFIGVEIAGPAATGNVIQSNRVGTNLTGLAAIPNGFDGVFINNAPDNLIGGTNEGQGNQISGNGSVGIQLFGGATRGNAIVGNSLGLDANGQPTLANRRGGIFVNTAANANQIGGAGAGEANQGQSLPRFVVTPIQSIARRRPRFPATAGRRPSPGGLIPSPPPRRAPGGR